ncbi:type 1 fimbrial protein [Providencia rettgeri]|uniref:fimbrial protein n=1 Tax=Providencia TaxID=586 RepID=UPI00204D93B7|nr:MULTISPECIES: fimbrial protein [Providencia]MCL0001370.1 type 1 fimbrial protein [Providencia rettgeri]MCX9125602.1 type 1 fimbrial protein [Providencia rettgeri]MCX9129306.1 type 1 fimbrial protein [Providencia rettgeri]UPQ39482.1 type 1 fimbrial protein [Providencia rettgeri]HEM6846534.1 type 1 fimbrial protein [Providencia rettgeri]
MKNVFYLVIVFFIPQLTFSKDTDIHFYGTLISEPCTLSLDSEEQLIDFGPIIKSTFNNNTVAAKRNVNITLNGCDISISKFVKFTFHGDKFSDNEELFAVTGEAKGIAIKLISEDGDNISPDVPMSDIELSSGTNQLNIEAMLVGYDLSKISTGSFSSVVTFSMSYD